MKNKDPFKSEFWEEFAMSKGCDHTNEKCLQPETWDKIATTYDDLELCKDYQEQLSTIISILQQKGALDKKNMVLDVACGTGNYSIRIAPFVKEVVALDVSRGMLSQLEKKKERFGIENIRVINADWMTYALSEGFDLVFCSMTPLLRSPGTIKKFLEASRRFVGIVTWAGVRHNEMLDAISKKIFGRPFEQKRQDINFVFNYLYTLGHAPHLTFFTGCWDRIRPVSVQVENLIWRLEMKRQLSSDEKEIVRKEVERRADRNSKVKVVTRVRTCFMLLDKLQSSGAFDCDRND